MTIFDTHTDVICENIYFNTIFNKKTSGFTVFQHQENYRLSI